MEENLTTPETEVEEPIDTTESHQEDVSESDQPSEEQVEKKKYRVKVAGEELEVDEDELLAGYQRNADSTRKWQEAAELKKAAEAERERFVRMNAEQAQTFQALAGIDAQLQQYQSVNWQQLSDNDPAQAQKLWIHFQQLKEQRQNAAQHLAGIEQAKQFEQQQILAKQVEQGHRVLEREIPNWSKETAGKVREFAEKELGFTAQELSQIYDPRVVKLLHAAMVGSSLAKQKTAPTQPDAPKPVTKVGGTASGPRDMSRMSTDEWMKARNAELRKRR